MNTNTEPMLPVCSTFWHDAPFDVTDKRLYTADQMLAMYAKGQAEGGEAELQFSLGEAKALVEFFGGDNTSVSVAEFPARQDTDEGLSEAGKYAWCTDYPEEGCMYLGPHDIDTEEHNEPAHPAKAVEVTEELAEKVLTEYVRLRLTVPDHMDEGRDGRIKFMRAALSAALGDGK